ncbi:sugar-binding protein [Pseudochryseolinea flava]|nr:sugar-binding protein [Pseudochryseolinea flava]
MKSATLLIDFFREQDLLTRARACLLTLLVVMINQSLLFGQTDGIPRGAQLPYTRYESENGTAGGGASLQSAPTYDQELIASEATNQKYVSLGSNGAYVEWTATASFQGVNLRFTMPDNATGTGNTGSLSLFVDGVKVKTINLTSRWAYQYFPSGQHEPIQTPGGKTFMRFDEVHFKLDNAVPAGKTVRVVKDNGDAFTYGVDFLELEPVPTPLGAPPNSLSVVDYGANGSDNNDDLAAFYSCLNAAKAQGKNVYIPAGRFLLSDRLDFNYNNLKFQGAGIWHTEIFFSTDLQFTGGILARASNVEISDFSLNTANNDRFHYGETNPKYSNVHGEPYKIYKGFMGTYGTGSRIHDVWIEHFECGFWIAGYDPPYPIDVTTDLIITRARIRNNYADGVNFCQGTNNSVVEYSSIRNSGDDGLAMWPNNALNAPVETNNIFRYNTIENTWRAGGIAIFGGWGHQVYRNIIRDGVGGSAIRFTNDFSGYKFEAGKPKIVLTDNYIVSCGTSKDLWDQKRGAIEFFTPQGVFDMEFNNTQIINSQRHAVQIYGSTTNLTFNNTKIDGTGVDYYTDQPNMDDWGGFGILTQANGDVTFTGISFNRLESGELKKHNQSYIVNIIPGNVGLTGITLSPTTVNIAEGKTAQLTIAYTPSNASNKTINWTSSNSSVATVAGTGTGLATITGVAVGTATITATSADGNFTRTCSVSVTPAVNITATDATAGEGGNVGTFVISTSATSSNITVPYTLSGTASSGDYGPALSGSVTLTPSAPSATVTITPVDDSAFEGPESVILTIQAGTGYSLGGNTSATISISDNENPPCTSPAIGFTSSAPSIDQTIDAVWNNVPAGTLSKVTLGSMPSDFSGSRWRAMYDATNLYVLVEVKDNNKFNDSGTSWWEDDVVEVFIDGDNSKGTSYDHVNDFQLGFRYNSTSVSVGGNSVTNTTGIVFAMQNVTGGYNLEARIPWSTIGVTAAVGKQIGFDISVDDDDNGGTRDSQVASFASTSMGWSDPSLFGSVYLTTCSSQPPVLVTGVTVTPSTGSVGVGSTLQLTATVSPSNATNQTVSWSSSNSSVASVSNTGVVSGVSNGSAVITVTTQDGGKTSTSNITVTAVSVPVSSVSVTPTTSSLTVGQTVQFTATVSPSNATNKTVSWSSSNANATVNASGLVTANAAGTSVITVTTQDGNKTATSSVTITSSPSPQTPYPGPTAWGIPGTIEAENFDNGGQGVAFNDSDVTNSGNQGRTTLGVDTETCSEGGLNVGWTSTGEWLEYTVSVATSGTYTIDVRTASTLSGGSFHIEFNGVDKTGLLTTSATGSWQTWSSVIKTGVQLSTGTQVMRLYFDNANFNVNKITITAGGSDPNGTITCYRSPGSVTVNGNLNETGWDVTKVFSKATVGSPNNTASFGVLWDNTNLYIGARVLDANLFSDSSDPWEDDAVEIYIDANNNKLGSYDGQDNQIIKNYNKSTVFTKVGISGLQHAWSSIAGGYSIEMAIPWSQLGISSPAAGTTIGFDIGYDDDDNGGSREHQAVWNGSVNNYASTAGFGSLVLSGSNARMRIESLGEVAEAQTVEYYPNEVTDKLHIKTDGSYELVEVIDGMGRSLQVESMLDKKDITLDMNGVSSGLHLVRLKGTTHHHVFRIIKK